MPCWYSDLGLENKPFLERLRKWSNEPYSTRDPEILKNLMIECAAAQDPVLGMKVVAAFAQWEEEHA